MARERDGTETRAVRGRRKDLTCHVSRGGGREGERTTRNGEKKSR